MATATKNGTATNRVAAVSRDDAPKVAVSITAPNIKSVSVKIIGTSPYVQNKFGAKAREQMRNTQTEGGTAKSRKKRAPKDFKACYNDAFYRPINGKWYAIPATAIKAAMIDACRLTDMKMTVGKQAFWIKEDGMDEEGYIPLIRITKGEPKYFEQTVRNANGSPDIRARPMWEAGWEAIIRIEYDADRLTMQDVINLLHRAGIQVGIGEGRQSSKQCVGLGWGAFRIGGVDD